MNKILNEIANLKTPIDIVEYAANRVAYLEKVTPVCEISHIKSGSQLYKGYINMGSGIYANIVFLPPFYIDDFNLYINFINYAKDNFGLEAFSKFDFKSIIALVQMFIETTFSSVDKSRTDRETIYDNSDSHVSIKDFYGNGSAKCIERTATVQNILAFLGIDTYLAFNDLSINNNDNDNNDNNKEGHVINIIRYNNKLWAYDSKNLMTCERKGKIIALPALVELSEDDIMKVKEFIMKSSDSASLYNVEPHKEYRKRKYELY